MIDGKKTNWVSTMKSHGGHSHCWKPQGFRCVDRCWCGVLLGWFRGWRWLCLGCLGDIFPVGRTINTRPRSTLEVVLVLYLTNWGKKIQDQISTGVREVCASGAAFAALKIDGSVVTWGHRDYGGDSRSVRDELRNGVALEALKFGQAELTLSIE